MRQLLVLGPKTFKITIPDDAKVTFGPWSPPVKRERGGRSWDEPSDKQGTLRIYSGKSEKTGNILAVFAGVHGFRDLTLGYAEEVAREEGATIWKDDEKGYMREDKVKRTKDWVEAEALPKELPSRRRG